MRWWFIKYSSLHTKMNKRWIKKKLPPYLKYCVAVLKVLKTLKSKEQKMMFKYDYGLKIAI